MNKIIRNLADQAKQSVPQGILSPDKWIEIYNEKFAELVAESCAQLCMSQADRKNIRLAFDLPVESSVKYKGPEPSNSIESQYNRDLNTQKIE
jgi:hypothetical protein